MPVRVELLTDVSEQVEADLAEVLLDCVAGGASVGFLYDLTSADARSWWHSALRQPDVLTWTASTEEDRTVGVVRLELVTNPNGRHRAHVAKLLVHSDGRRLGCATGLMDALEQAAVDAGRRLLILDTETDSGAQTFYARRGWTVLGVVPDYACTPDGQPAATTFMMKKL